MIKLWRGASVALCAALPLGAVGVAPPASASAAGRERGGWERKVLRPGMQGPDVVRLQRRLAALHYVPGGFSGRYEAPTVAAVWAFQKVNGLPATGLVGKRTWRALDRPRRPRKLVRGAPRDRIEVNLRKRLVVVYDRGKIALISHISPGSGERYCVAGHCTRAITPVGNFRVHRKLRFWHRSRLGLMYNSVYFHGGYAMHGSISVPRHAASHGCIRLPMHASKLLFRMVRKGEPVYVRRPGR